MNFIMNHSLDAFLAYEATNIDDPSLLPHLKEINETVEARAKTLEILRRELKNLQDIEPCLEENFLLRFLRVSKFDTSKAFQRILKYYQQQDKAIEALRKTPVPLEKARSVNHIWLSPYRPKNNSALVFLLAGKIDHSKITFADLFCLDLLALSEELQNPVNQITGATVICDYEGFTLRSCKAYTPRWLLLFAEVFVNAFPVRVRSVHFVNAPSIFLTVFKILHSILPKKLKGRVFMHPNDDWKSLHAAIPPEILPEQYGGHLKFASCINALKNIEELDDHFCKMLKYGYIKTKEKRQTFKLISRKD